MAVNQEIVNLHESLRRYFDVNDKSSIIFKFFLSEDKKGNAVCVAISPCGNNFSVIAFRGSPRQKNYPTKPRSRWVLNANDLEMMTPRDSRLMEDPVLGYDNVMVLIAQGMLRL